jgi:hypothetical protein
MSGCTLDGCIADLYMLAIGLGGNVVGGEEFLQ